MNMNNLIVPAHEHPHHKRIVIIVAILLGLVVIGGVIYYAVMTHRAKNSDQRALKESMIQAEQFFKENPAQPLTAADLAQTDEFFKNNKSQ